MSNIVLFFYLIVLPAASATTAPSRAATALYFTKGSPFTADRSSSIFIIVINL